MTVILPIILIISIVILVIYSGIIFYSGRYLIYHPPNKRLPLYHAEMQACYQRLAPHWTEITLKNDQQQSIYAWFLPNNGYVMPAKASPHFNSLLAQIKRPLAIGGSIALAQPNQRASAPTNHHKYNGNYVIVLQHGHRQNRHEMLQQAQYFYEAGYSLLITTLRCHDNSDGTWIDFGLAESEDIRCWHNFLIQTAAFKPNHIALVGNSMGGVVLLNAHRRYHLGAVLVLQSVLTTLPQTIAYRTHVITRLPGKWLTLPLGYLLQRFYHFNMNAVTPVKWAESITIPTFVMHGGKDTLVPPTSGKDLYRALDHLAAEQKFLWHEPHQAHVRFELDHPQKFQAQVVAFVEKHLKRTQNNI